MKPGSKYYPLFEHLQHCNQEAVTLTFAEIEALMGCSLPTSARNKKTGRAIVIVLAPYKLEPGLAQATKLSS
ncbi:DUF7662 domain-containing protein [Gloeocapsopsis dulcis]|uniref:DUF7662 domain-containing protein n=1 Tax=Gloeocapsopsis dulcis AAB1 = 1H9 TaxID=1433147 RepID=A0A6N8FVL4_9CHRO|nr:hypothetical protein [Gloeocapsopsis dulcis]MUL36981.1 hypothetical protein [Gloeocapsopsis dulcis AAB1 = 1H9]